MKKHLLGILLLMSSLALTACSVNHNVTRVFANEFQPTELIKAFNTEPINLASRSKCSSPPSIKIINVEKNEGDYIIQEFWPGIITPKIFVDSIVDYMSDSFNRAGIKTDNNSKKIMEISLVKLNTSITEFNHHAKTQLKITIPEKKYTAIYEHTDSTPKGVSVAVAYTIHGITWKILNDPIIQDYLLCTNWGTEESALDILKKRYASGEITKDEFERMKKDIQ